MDNQVNEIRKANDIVDVISSYLPLTKKGKNYFGVCPFHDDTNPSMSVSQDKQIYKCFSCGASGNVITFVMDYEHVDFKEALSSLARRVGIDFKISGLKSQVTKYDKYYKMYDISLRLYQNNINSALGKGAVEYLERRGISKDLIKEFKIGLALGKNSLTNVLTKKDYSTLEIEEYGLGTGYNDLYINRIMFPLFDTNNRPVGFSGRIYNTSDTSKYINTKETPIFKKGEILYNYYKAKEYVREKKSVIITEGFMDVIRLFSIGVRNVVALMGTALTHEQVGLLKRLSHDIYICLDGDNAGQKATLKVGDELSNAGFNIKVITLKDGLDPDEYVLKYGKESFLDLYDNAVAFNEYKLYHMRDGLDLSNLEEKTAYINTVLKEVKQEDDEIKQEFLLKKISLEFDIDVNILKNTLKKIEKYSKIEALKTKPVVNRKLDKYQKATYDILYIMLNSYEKTKLYEKKLNYLPYKEARYLANEIIYTYKMKGSLVLADFITSLTDKENLMKEAKEVLKYAGDEEANLEAFEDYMAVIRDYSKNQEIKRLKELIREEIDPVKKAEILEKIRLVKIGSEF